jgi:FdhD protein
MTGTHRTLPLRGWRTGGWQAGTRTVPEEVPVAISYNGTTQAVLMATPADLADFARGFTLTEGIATLAEIEDISVEQTSGGFDAQIWLAEGADARLAARRRTMLGPVGCGLCGIDSIDAALRAVPRIGAEGPCFTPAQIMNAMARLPDGQTLHDITRAAHAAAFLHPGHGLGPLREDVGRHNALDKLAGAMAAAGLCASQGALVLTSRVSIDLVQKAATLGAPVLVAASAPTAHAVDLARDAGLTLVALARPEGFEVFTHPHRIARSETADVA